MKGFAIKNMKVTPGGDSSATSRKYVDRKLDTKANKNDLNAYLKLDGSSQMQGHLRMNNKRIIGLNINPSFDGEAASKKYVDVKLNTETDKTSLTMFVKKDSPEVAGDLDMKGYAIKNMKVTPGGDSSATSREYVDGELNNYLKLDGTSQRQDNIVMNNNRITRLPEPQLADEPATKKICCNNYASSSQSLFRSTRYIYNVGKSSNE